MMASFVFATKIVLYQEHKFNLRSQIINFGYRAKLYLVKIESRYQLVRPTNKSKLSLNQVPHFDMLVLDDEKPREEETKAFEGSTLPSSVTPLNVNHRKVTRMRTSSRLPSRPRRT
jgi:hypothetical protein